MASTSVLSPAIRVTASGSLLTLSAQQSPFAEVNSRVDKDECASRFAVAMRRAVCWASSKTNFSPLMSLVFSTETSGELVIIRLGDNVTADEVIEALDEIASATQRFRCRLWDVASGIRFSSSQIREIADHGKKWSGPAKVAYLARDDLSFGLLRMFEGYSERGQFETRVFREKPWAAAERILPLSAGTEPMSIEPDCPPAADIRPVCPQALRDTPAPPASG